MRQGLAVALLLCGAAGLARAQDDLVAPPAASQHDTSSAYDAPTVEARRQRCQATGGAWTKTGCDCSAEPGSAEYAGRCGTASHAVASRNALLAGLFNDYSPTVLLQTVSTPAGPKRIQSMWTGGWLTSSDIPPAGDGADKIYYSEYGAKGWSFPALSFAKPGFHVNDPSVLVHPRHKDWRFMYYTELSNDDATAGRMTLGNVVGLASSIDGGRTWTDRGIVIDHDNGLDQAGAWSPSALVVGSQIWVYFHTGSQDFTRPIMLRRRFDLNGWQPIGATERLSFPDDQYGTGVTQLSNVDVSAGGGGFVMLGDDLGLRQIYRYVSKDGLTWYRDPVSPLIDGPQNLVLTPHLQPQGAGAYSVYFGYGTPYSQSIQAWTFSAGAPSTLP